MSEHNAESGGGVAVQRMVRHAIPDMNDRKRYRYELAMPLVLTLDLDEQFGPDEIMEMYRRVMKEEIRIKISGCNSTGCYELYCNVEVPNEKLRDAGESGVEQH